jgi:hypothetical protein
MDLVELAEQVVLAKRVEQSVRALYRDCRICAAGTRQEPVDEPEEVRHKSWETGVKQSQCPGLPAYDDLCITALDCRDDLARRILGAE